jgi:hypothetical protein
MSLTFFLAFCILGCDFLLYVLFQWVYGEKHRKAGRRSASRKVRDQAAAARAAREVGRARVLAFSQSAVRSRTGYF